MASAMHEVAICQVNQTDANCGCNQALRFQAGSRPKLTRAMANASPQASTQQSATLIMHKALRNCACAEPRLATVWLTPAHWRPPTQQRLPPREYPGELDLRREHLWLVADPESRSALPSTDWR